MTQRIDWHNNVPEFYQAMLGLEKAARSGGADPSLNELIKIRCSQINGCAYCLDMHLADARKAGETQRRLDVLAAWREAPSLFSDAERAALALAESVTRVGDDGLPDPVWDDAVAALGEDGVAQILAATVAINSWNRLQVATRADLPARG